MTTDFVEDKVSLGDTDAPATRWESGRLDLDAEPEAPERAGVVLAALIALLMPLIVGAVVLMPTSSVDESVSTVDGRASTGLDGISIGPVPDGADAAEAVDTDVLGTTEVLEDEPADGSDPITTDDAEPGVRDRTEVATPTTVTPAPPDSVVAPTPSVSATTSPSTVEPSPPTDEPPTTPASSTPPASTSSVAPTTSATPTSTVVSTTGAPPPTTATTAPVTTLAPDGEPDPPAFAQRVEIAQIGDTFVRYRFTAETTTAYAAVVRDQSGIVATTTGTAVGGEEVSKSANGLTPGTDYTVMVTLLGPPEATSVAVPFRTSGGTPDPADEPVEILDVELGEIGETQFVVTYRTNICANGSFVIRRLGGGVVGRNGGQADGCTTRHLAVPGLWTPELEPGVTYLLTISAEADGQGRGGGNVATTSIVVTTAG